MNNYTEVHMAGSEKTKVFVDGRAGTTGLGILKRLEKKARYRAHHAAEEKRKDPPPGAKRSIPATLPFLCLPDAAAIESSEMVI
jgi:N-acetyl-gamma-glutamyl-phosphate reductase